MRAPEFEASLSAAKLYPQLWRLLLGIGLTLLIWIGATAIVFGLAAAYVAVTQDPMFVLGFFNRLQAPNTPVAVITLLATFSGLMIGALTAAAALHGRGPGTLFGPWGDWVRGFVMALAVLLPIYAVLVGLSFLFDTPVPNLDPRQWLTLLPLTILFILLQTGAEEVFFRGYLQQQLAARFRARWVWMWLPSVVFALLHVNPDAGANLPLVLLAALVFGLVAADLTERTGSLGAAMGLHFGNNFIGIAVLSISDTISGLALFVTPLDLSVAGPQSLSLAASILVMLGIWAIVAWRLDA